MTQLTAKQQSLLDDYNQFLVRENVSATFRRDAAGLARRLLVYLRSEGKEDILALTQTDYQKFLFTFQRHKSSTYNLYISYLKKFLRFLEAYYELGHIVLQNKKVEKNLPNYLPVEVLHQLCTPSEDEYADLLHKLTPARDQAMVEILVSTGIRSCELRRLKIGDISPDYRICRIVTAKRGSARLAFLGLPAAAALRNYLRLRGIQFKKDRDYWLFPGKNPQNPISYIRVRNSLITLAKKRIGTPVTPHVLRHSFATEMLRGCGCIRSVQLLLGHVKISNTARYCHLNITDAMKAVENFHPHGQKRFPDEEVDKKE